MDIAVFLILCIVPYLIGSINFSILISKKMGGDIRNSGSGNAGATNMLRTYGKLPAVITLICDILKGCVGVFFGVLLAFLCERFIVKMGSNMTGISVSVKSYNNIAALNPYFFLISGFMAILGHNFPVFFKFKGGKGVATSLGVIFALNWRIGLIALVFALAVIIITRYVSLGSIAGAFAYLVANFTYMLFTDTFSLIRLIFDILVVGLLILRHRENIKRLINKTESKLGQKKEN